MDVDSILAWAGLIFAGLIAAFVAAAEVSLATISQANVRRLLDEGVSRAQAVQTLLQNPPRYVLALMVLKVAAYLGAGGFAIWLVVQQGVQSDLIIFLAILIVGFLMLTIQITARALSLRALETVALRLGPPVRVVALLLSPITAFYQWLAGLMTGRNGDAVVENLFLSEDGLRFLLQVGDEPGLIEEDEKEMIARVFELSETVVREVMVPRIDIVAVEADTPVLEALDLIIDAGHSRIPVYRDYADNVQGVLYAKDLLPALREGRQDVSITALMRPAYFVPDSKKVDDLLRELQQLKIHLAVVIDEYGGTAGVVTIEDLLEEIVGEIQDEYDSELPQFISVSEDEYLFDAGISLDEVSRILGVDLPDEVSDTLGGFIFSQLGRVAGVGSTVRFDRLLMEVESVNGRRIRQVRVRRLPVLEAIEAEET